VFPPAVSTLGLLPQLFKNCLAAMQWQSHPLGQHSGVNFQVTFGVLDVFEGKEKTKGNLLRSGRDRDILQQFLLSYA
jgi:hypothetical protein